MVQKATIDYSKPSLIKRIDKDYNCVTCQVEFSPRNVLPVVPSPSPLLPAPGQMVSGIPCYCRYGDQDKVLSANMPALKTLSPCSLAQSP